MAKPDIVERLEILKKHVVIRSKWKDYGVPIHDDLKDAIAEIERLRAKVDSYQKLAAQVHSMFKDKKEKP